MPQAAMNAKPLAGLRVLDLSRLLPGPACTLYLADLGADVIKIEDEAQGDYARSLQPALFKAINRNKRGMCLDLRQTDGRETFLRLVERADVVVESFRPGVMDRLGVGYEILRERNPALVYCALTGYGQSGPYRNRAGHDVNYRALSGQLEQSGPAGGAPDLSNFQVADIAGGALTAALGILAAVLRARETGEGALVDAAMLDGTLALQWVALASLAQSGATRPRGTDVLSGGLPNYSVYACRDGHYLAVGALEAKFWGMFCDAIGQPGWKSRPLTGAGSEATRADLADLLRTRTRDEWMALLGDTDACVSPVLTLEEALADEHVVSRGMVCQVDGLPQFACPIKLSGYRFEVERAAPEPGEHSAEILAEFGLKN